ncbi:restriction endonuclease subunit S [Metallibacterium scheffleri]|uniref:Type I restriction modification DNA specificity domain-containing protein n=2 Tax=Metallibacterium scheffleri TaxID=993689 RepID=A0A4S3KI29_9GAMM|nr:restriction endonuclease subunit S [Metallibacterium scheffleri]THD08363.1 hypothetical protein B1806_13355 [Metallibacterium scheffleri]
MRWSTVTIGGVCSKPQYGWTTKAMSEGGRIRLLRTTDITSGEIDWSTVPFCTDEPPDVDKYLLHEGDIVISRAGSVGVSYLITRVKPSVFASYLIRFRPGPTVEGRYLAYFLKSRDYWQQIADNTSGIAIPNVNASKISDIRLPLAPLALQRRIVAEIEKQFSRLDQAVASLQRVKAQLKRYKASVLKAAVEGRLVETEADRARREGRSFETGAELAAQGSANAAGGRKPGAALPYETGEQLLKRILDTRRSQWKGNGKYKEPAAPDTSGLPKLPEGWVWCGFEQVSSADKHALKAGPFGSALKKDVYVPSGYKIYGQEQVIRGDHSFGDYFIEEAKFRELENCTVKPGDLLISLVGTAGKVLVLPENARPGIINPRLIKLSLNPSFIAPAYAAYMLQSAWATLFFKGQAHGGTMEILNLGIVKTLPVPLPPLREQHRIVAEVDRRLSIVREVEAEVDANLKRAQALRQSVLTRAFAGDAG